MAHDSTHVARKAAMQFDALVRTLIELRNAYDAEYIANADPRAVQGGARCGFAIETDTLIGDVTRARRDFADTNCA